MADTEELKFRALGEDVSAGKMLNKLGDAADDAKDEVKGLGRQLGKLDEQIDLTKLHLAGLVKEFNKTGDKALFRDIRKDRSTLNLLQAMKKELEEDPPKRNWFSKLFDNLGDTLGSLPSELKGAAIVGAVGAGAAMAPLLGAAVAGAVLGGVGSGGIIGGIALAAQDERVAAAGKQIGQHLLGELQADGQSFVGPVVAALDQLDDATTDLLSDVGDEFRDLRDLVAPLSRGVAGLIRNLGPGLSDALDKAEPVIRVLAQELPELGDSISYALSAISDESDGAAMGLAELFHIIEYGIEFTGDFVATLSSVFEWLVRTSDAAAEFYEAFNPAGAVLAALPLTALQDETSALIDDLDRAKSATDTYVGSVDLLGYSMEEQAARTEAARRALVEYGKSVADQFDPTANLVHRLQDLKTAQHDLKDAIKEHGAKSQEARDAELKLAEATLAVQSAALAAQGTFDGHFTPALRNILKEGGLTEKQINDVEKSFRDATKAGNDFSKTYKAKLILDTSQVYGSLAAARNAIEGNEYVSGRASGGPVGAGKTYMVGEDGPELVTFGADGYVHNATDTQAMLAGATGGSASPWTGGGASVVESRVIVDVRGGDDDLKRLVLKWLRTDPGFAASVASAL